MFEKEAEEYACEYARQYLHNDGSGLTNSYCETYNGYYRGANDGYNKANEWHKLDWEKDFPDVDKLVRVRTKSGEEYICQTYLYYLAEDEIGYGSTITQFEELNGDWIDDNEIEYWCYIEPFKEIKENDR